MVLCVCCPETSTSVHSILCVAFHNMFCKGDGAMDCAIACREVREWLH